jgi:hypothetical protein
MATLRVLCLQKKINNCKEFAVNNAIDELGGTYEAALVPPETPNYDVAALVSNKRATWRSNFTTRFKGQSAHDGDDDGAVVHFHCLANDEQQQQLLDRQDEAQQHEREQ